MRYAQNKNELNEFFLNGKYIWEVDLPSIITINTTEGVHNFNGVIFSNLKPDYKLDNIYVSLKSGISPARDNSFWISVYEPDEPSTSKLYINNKTVKQRYSYYEDAINYGKTWWMLNYKYIDQLKDIFKEENYESDNLSISQ